MQEITTLTALVMRRARDLIADYGWPDHTDVDQRDPVNKPGWISIYVRLDAANIAHLLPLLCTGEVPAELQSAMTKTCPTTVEISGISSGVNATAFSFKVHRMFVNKSLFLLSVLFSAGLVQATEHTENRQFIQEQLKLDRQRFRELQTPEFLKQPRPVAPQEQSFLDAQAQQFRQSMQPGERPVEAALVFVSFSMPPDELKQRVQDAAALNIPVVIRGMVNGDMRATANAVAGLVKESNTGGVQIDPTTFRKYNITAVPVLIVTCGNQGDQVDRLQGDLMLHQALKRVAEEGDCAQTAKSLLGEEGE